MRATRCICNDETIYHLEQRMREEEKSKATMEK